MMLLCCSIFGQDKQPLEKRKYTTQAIKDVVPPQIDGVLNDAAWGQVEWGGDFIQRIPNEGEAPGQNTQFKILYDDRFLYVALNCLDTEPKNIVKQLSRRDGFEGDFIIVSLDSYHDLTTCFSFVVTAAGVKGDELLSQNGNSSDGNWNPIWYTDAKINADGWSAEMKIPLTQLRFSAIEDQVWGMQIDRKIFDSTQRVSWQRVRQDDAGWVSNFGELHGLKNLKPKRQVELQPYTVAKLEKKESQAGNPFATGTDTQITAGLDGKIGVTNDLTLDFTINPDFGQVEADPAAVTLDGYQQFFGEQRPFFVENSNIFSYPFSRSEAGNTFWSDNLFYSRRIGKNPSHYPGLSDGEYSERPTNTTILGAAKLSGKTKKGWSLGIMESVTAKEYETIDNNGETREELIEPLTSYFVSRVSKDFNKRNSVIGGILTSTNRKLEGDLDFLHKSAVTGGLDFSHHWKDRAWYVKGNFIASQVTGTKDAIYNTQTNITHLLDRPEADHLEVDTAATSLRGTGGMVKIGRVGGSNWMFETGATFRSPKLELNDIGFLRTGDDIRSFTWGAHRWREPFSIFNNMQVNGNQWIVTDFGGNLKEWSYNFNMNMWFKNNMSFGIGSNIIAVNISNSVLRGGPRFAAMPSLGPSMWFNSDNRKRVSWGGNGWADLAQDKANVFVGGNLYLKCRPMNTLDFTLNFHHSAQKNKLQYVSQADVADQTKYIISEMDRKTVAFSLRVNYTINPNLTLQYYGEPYATKGEYSDFKEVTNGTAKNYEDKFYGYNSSQVSYNADQGAYHFDKNKDGQNEFSIGNPDFSYVQFRSNLVLRWEYLPGSELFLVWSQGATGSGSPQDDLFRTLDQEIASKKLENIFLLKATYRLSL